MIISKWFPHAYAIVWAIAYHFDISCTQKFIWFDFRITVIVLCFKLWHHFECFNWIVLGGVTADWIARNIDEYFTKIVYGLVLYSTVCPYPWIVQHWQLEITEVMAWISNYNYVELCDVIIHPFRWWKLDQGGVITSLQFNSLDPGKF